MSDDESAALFISATVALFTWGRWYWQHAAVGVPGRSASGRWLLLATPPICLLLLFVILKRAASFDVRDSPIYLFLYLVMGAGWIGAVMLLSIFAGVSARDDVIERGNVAAATSLAGAMVGVTLAFAGGNVGDGPGWWVVVAAAGIATAGLVALWLALDTIAHVGDAITIDRDRATGLRLAGFLVAAGIILGSAVAGDWVSMGATLRDFALRGWPALVLLAVATVVERASRPRAERPGPPVPVFGLLPALAYTIGALVVASNAWRAP